MRTILTRLQAELKTRQAAQLAEKAAKARSEEGVFLASNKGKAGVVTLESGLQYRILKAGEGKKPAIDDTVVCHYRGTLVDGTEFDSSYKRNKPATFALKRVIKGWTEALQMMPVGSTWQLFIPSSLAYGERGTGKSVPPNATLVFEVELLSIQDSAASRTADAEAQLARTVPAPAAAVPGITLSFKLDPRLTKGLYMGDRWVSLPYSQVGERNQVTIEARAEGVDDKGKPTSISPKWIAADPEMVTVTPNQGNAVRITALRPGESGLQVTSGGSSRELTIKAAYKGDALVVEISEKQS
jgi:FKBP-type peptidyl-prolyl cis-trans isomerase